MGKKGLSQSHLNKGRGRRAIVCLGRVLRWCGWRHTVGTIGDPVHGARSLGRLLEVNYICLSGAAPAIGDQGQDGNAEDGWSEGSRVGQRVRLIKKRGGGNYRLKGRLLYGLCS